MFKKTVMMSVLALILGIAQLQAQDTLRILNSFIQLELDSTNSHNPPSIINNSNASSIGFCVKVAAFFSDTADIDSIHIKVGRTAGGQDVANLSFAYNGGNISPVLPEFVATEDGFCLCVAESAYNSYTLFLEIWAEDKIGNTTNVYSMHVN